MRNFFGRDPHPMAIKFWWTVFAFTAVVIVCIFTFYGVVAYTSMKDPGVIGETAGTIVKRFNDTSK